MFIYALCAPETGDVRYVGQANNPTRRHRLHLKDQTDTRRGRWIRTLLCCGRAPTLLILERINGDWQEAERRWIASYRAAGADLTNHTDGGEGILNASEETRSKLRALRTAEWQNPATRDTLPEGAISEMV